MADKNLITVDGRKYEFLPKNIRFENKVYSAEDVIANKDLHTRLIEQSWEGRHGKLDEADYDRNGLFRIVYEAKAKAGTNNTETGADPSKPKK